MGFEFSLSCRSCGFDKRFIVGTGLKYSSLEAAIDHIHPIRRPKVRELLSFHQIQETDFGRRIYHCAKCGQLLNPFWVRIVYDDDQIYETYFQCGKCQKPKTLIQEHQLKNMVCPCCRMDKLHLITEKLQK